MSDVAALAKRLSASAARRGGVCQSCLSRGAAVSWDVLLKAMPRLRLMPGVRVSTGTCGECERLRMLVGVDEEVQRP